MPRSTESNETSLIYIRTTQKYVGYLSIKKASHDLIKPYKINKPIAPLHYWTIQIEEKNELLFRLAQKCNEPRKWIDQITPLNNNFLLLIYIQYQLRQQCRSSWNQQSKIYGKYECWDYSKRKDRFKLAKMQSERKTYGWYFLLMDYSVVYNVVIIFGIFSKSTILIIWSIFDYIDHE